MITITAIQMRQDQVPANASHLPFYKICSFNPEKSMKTTIRLVTLAALVLFAVPARSATNVIIAGDNFQAKIDAASPGDTLVVQASVYSGNLNFSKPLTVVRSGTNQLQFSGNITISTTGTVIILQAQFAGTLSVLTNGTIFLANCACASSVSLPGAGTIQAFDCSFPGLSATGGNATVKRCNFAGDIALNNCSFEGLRLNVMGVLATAPVGSGKRFVLVQSYATRTLSLSGYQCSLGYSSFLIPNNWNYLISLVDCESTLVGNIGYLPRINGGDAKAVGVVRGSIRAFNNRLYMAGDNWDQHYYAIFGFHLATASGEIVNNSILTVGSSAYGIGGTIIGINVITGGGPVLVRANAIQQSTSNGGANVITTGVAQDGNQITQCSYNCIEVDHPPTLSGVLGVSTISAYPSFDAYPDLSLSPLNASFALLGGSPCIDSGPPAPIYSDSDGSQNDIGYSGGPSWNPANYTNSNPMVFWLMPTNQTVLKGLQSTIPISAAATAGH